MTRKEHLLKLMQKKEQLRMRQQANTVGSLTQQVDASKSLIDRLANLQAENLETDKLMTPQSLRSRSWYGRYVAEQKELAQSRLEFLVEELTGVRKQLAKSNNRKSILNDRFMDARNEREEEVDKRREGQMPPRQVPRG